MSDVRGTIQSIAADAEQITLSGRVEGGGDAPTLYVYECPPYADLCPAMEQPPVQAFALAPGKTTFAFSLPRYACGADRLYDKWSVGTEGEPRFDGPCYVTEWDEIPAPDYPYPTSPTIKGLQVHTVDDAIALGVGHAALNLNQPTIMRPAPTDTTITYEMDGREYYFDGEYMARYDQRVKELSDHGIVVTLILLNSPSWDGIEIYPELRETLFHPDYDPEGRISAFNVLTAEGLAHYKAFVEFVAERYTRPDARYGRACGYIIGNEVDAQWTWCNAGEKTVEQYVREHGLAMRVAFYAARKHYARARVYLSLTHYWTATHQDNPLRYYAGRDIVETLNRLYRAEGDWPWAMAYHPYPEDLFHPDFWNDKTPTDELDTPRITFKNIEVLPRYMGQPHLLYEGKQRHIILSEQGFHSDETEEGEELQAAAYAYAYYKVAREPGIESFILHAHVDNRDEFDLNLGIRRRDKSSPLANAPGEPKPAYDVFKDIDGPRQQELYDWAKTIVGEKWQ
jgi:hypothetical protein